MSFYTKFRHAFYTNSAFAFMRLTAKQRLKPKKRLRFEIEVTGHCNLNCKSCHHFSPISDQYFVKKEIFEKDFARLSELAGRNNQNIDIMGGEPLLHPEIAELARIARKYFDGPVNIVTSYPVKLNTKRIKELAKKHGAALKIRTRLIDKRVWTRLPFDLSGKQDITENRNFCLTVNTCIFLREGRISTCCLPLVADRFNNYFGDEAGARFEASDDDSIDIYKAKDIKEIYEFVSKPMSFCRYCRIKSWEMGIDWETSKKEMSEWV